MEVSQPWTETSLTKATEPVSETLVFHRRYVEVLTLRT